MPWGIKSVLSERSRFVLQSKSEESSHSELCRRFCISRVTGYKWLTRFEKHGLRGLSDQSRRPKTGASAIPHEITTQIVSYRQSHPSWGATKIRKILLRSFQEVPSRRSIHRVLQDCNLVSTRRYHYRRRAPKRVVVKALYSNHIWTVDFKGWWRTRDGKKVFPLTIRDEYSKMVISIKVCPRPTLELVKEAFTECFERYGLPEYIRSDNGTPFAYSGGLCGLSRLSAWWIKLGIVPNFIPPASPQFNAGHERMHRDMAQDLEATPARNRSQQQAIADQWREEFNTVRPHDALKDKTPSQVYRKSSIKYKTAEPALEYPEERMLKRFVNKQGAFRFKGKRYFLSKALGKENIGLEFTDSNTVNIWFGTTLLVQADAEFSNFLEYDLITGRLTDTKIVA